MDISKKGYPSMPSNYITIVDLKNRWLKQQQQQHQQEDDQQNEQEQTTHNLSNKDPVNCYDSKAKFHSQSHKHSPSNSVKNPNFTSQNGHLHVNKFGAVKKASKSSQINGATAKVQSNHISNNNDGGGKNERKNSQFRKRNAKFFGKKLGEEFRVVKKGSSSSSESSQINVATAKVKSNHISNNEDEVGEEVRKNPQFRENPNFKIRTTNYRKFKGEKRLKDSETNIAAATVDNDDRKVEDEDTNVKEKKKKKKGKKKKNKKKNEMTIVDDQTVEKKDILDETEDQTVEKKEKQDGGGDQTVAKEGNQNEGEDQTVEKKDNQDEGEDQTVEKKDNKDGGEDQTVEIEGMVKEVNVNEKNERSTAVIKEKGRVYGGYRRVNRREYGKVSWGVRREKGIQDETSMAASQGEREVYRGYGGAEHRGSYHRRNFRREENLFDRNCGRSTAVNERWRGVHRVYSGGENREMSWRRTTMGELKWVKKNEEHP